MTVRMSLSLKLARSCRRAAASGARAGWAARISGRSEMNVNLTVITALSEEFSYLP
jgi:hypothetical protein